MYRYYRDFENQQEVCEKLVNLEWVEYSRKPLSRVKGTRQTIRNVDPYVWLDFADYCENYGFTQAEGLAQIMDCVRGNQVELTAGGSSNKGAAGSRQAATPPDLSVLPVVYRYDRGQSVSQ